MAYDSNDIIFIYGLEKKYKFKTTSLCCQGV